MSFFHWCMRYGAAILFVIAGLQLLIGIIVVLQTFGAMTGNSGFPGASDAGRMQVLLVLQGLMTVFTTAALPFFGALVVHRLDRRHRPDPREAEPFE